MHGEPTRGRGLATDLAVAALLAVLGALFYKALFQDRMLGDGAGLATFFARGDRLAYHFLYLPACRLVEPLSAWTAAGDPIEATRILSAVALALGLAFTWLLARELGVGRLGALVGTLLVGLSPAGLFFGTTVEVHALHLAVVAAAAFATLKLPWRSPSLALPLAAFAFGLCFWAHQMAVLLTPAWVGLCQIGARRVGCEFTLRALLVKVAPSLVLGVVVASALATFLRTGSPLPSAETELGILSTFTRPPGAWLFFWNGWLLPLAFLLPPAALGLARWEPEDHRHRPLVLAIVVPTLFLFAWGVAEYGGYTLGHAAFLAVAAGFAFQHPTRASVTIAVLLVAAQATLGLSVVRNFDRGWDVNERARLVEEHLKGGIFVATVDNAPSVTLYLDDVVEVALWDAVVAAHRRGVSDEDIPELLLNVARENVGVAGRVLVDLGFETQHDREAIRARLPFVDPLVEGLEAEFTTERIEHPHWPLLVVEP